MTKQKAKDKKAGGTIALNKRARHEYHIDERYEAGVALQGWEVKSLREGKALSGAMQDAGGFPPLLVASVLALGTVLERLLFLANERRKRDRRGGVASGIGEPEHRSHAHHEQDYREHAQQGRPKHGPHRRLAV